VLILHANRAAGQLRHARVLDFAPLEMGFTQTRVTNFTSPQLRSVGELLLQGCS
jgi:hypothetical protein